MDDRLHKQIFCLLLLGGLFMGGSGCHVLGIPSYRADAGLGSAEGAVACSDAQCSDVQCPPTVLPPLPGWLAARRAKKDLPQPAPYPRFHPLPTRPMFSPAETNFGADWPGEAAGFGHWPSASEGGLPASVGAMTAMPRDDQGSGSRNSP